MDFINHTPFPAFAFEGVDQRRQSFHVVVLRQTLSWNDAGELLFADQQSPLCDTDEPFDSAQSEGEPRQESDLCQYKPRCDVIVNATAHAPRSPQAKPVHRFDVRLVVKRPDTPAPIPPQPHALNPFMPVSADEMARWRAAVSQAERNPTPGRRLIDKILSVTGERRFTKREGAAQLGASMLKLGTLGVVRPAAWQLSDPAPVHNVPLRLALTFGGQCRIEAGTKAAAHVPKPHRLTPEQAASHPDAAAPPGAHEAFAANPAGQGYTRDWYLDATGTTSIAAPQIEHPASPITLQHFDQTRADRLDAAADGLVAGLGIRPKGHPERARLVGTVDAAFIRGDTALPADFDFTVWNAAWPDQRVDALQGDEIIELHNLCAAHTPGVRRDAEGNTLLRLSLPGHLPFVLVRFEHGAIGELAARLDTVLIEPEQRQLTCVWRATIGQQPEVRVLEARMLQRSQVESLRRRQAMTQARAETAHG